MIVIPNPRSAGEPFEEYYEPEAPEKREIVSSN